MRLSVRAAHVTVWRRDPRLMMVDLAAISALLAQRRPGGGLPQGLYNDPDAFTFDMEAIFARSWILVGFDIEVKRPGSWMSVMVGPWPVLITRDRDGVLHAFHNTCRHRGAMLCKPGKGHTARLVCPYHRWTYELSGELVSATRMGEHFRPGEHSLFPVCVESVCGVIYVCLAENPPDIAPFRRAIEPLLAPHRLLEAKLAHENVLIERGNWKLVM
jgi:Rieske 2Fe-2S family protein